MSVFGGDSWAREAGQRKRRVDDLIAGSINASAYQMLSSGKFSCLICPHNPVFDTLLVLSAHLKGLRHRAAELRLKDKELARQDEINKRLALSDNATDNSNRSYRLASKGLIDNTKKSVSDMHRDENVKQSPFLQPPELRCCRSLSISDSNGCVPTDVAPRHKGIQHTAYDPERHERELKFTAAGWKRDAHGRWFKDENVSIRIYLEELFE
ncbi:unnamed protein product [Cuscuta europaea]|uniref:Sodium channel modifier 1 zinc-finger domain-containing protein n=1 Tax=Cuscuta europaea TaxID=41803 RepID=A0A9P0Z0Q7_CUSEU|nr:unnamed protein product [Cuscuta europaea]